MCTPSPAAAGFSEAVGSAAVVRGPGLQAPILLFPYFYLLYVSSVPVHPPLDVQMCGILQHPVVLGRGTFVEL